MRAEAVSGCDSGQEVLSSPLPAASQRQRCCVAVLDVFAHLSMESNCTQADARMGFFGMLAGTLAGQQPAHVAQPCLIMLAASADPPSDLPL